MTDICPKHNRPLVSFCPACRGEVKSDRKRASSRANGRKGGRRKQTTESKENAVELKTVIQCASAYDTEIMQVRRGTDEEQLKFAEWYRPLLHYSVGESERISDIGLLDICSVLNNRHSDFPLPGCNNSCWIISDEEADKFRTLNAEKKQARETRERAKAQRDAEHEARLYASGLCPRCGTWCYGDCTSN